MVAVAILIISIQGALQASQLLLGLVVSAELFALIRFAEACLAVGVTFGSLGMNTLVLQRAAVAKPSEGLDILARTVLITLFSSITLIVVAVLITQLTSKSSAVSLATFLAGTLLSANLVRLLAGYVQAVRLEGEAAKPLLAISTLGVFTQVWAAQAFGTAGWSVTRYLTDLALVSALTYVIRLHVVPGTKRAQLRALLTSWTRLKGQGHNGVKELSVQGAKVNLGLGLRVLTDNLPLFAVGLSGASAPEVAALGFALMVITAVALPVFVVAQRRLPQIARASADELPARVRKMRTQIFLVSSVSMGGVMILALLDMSLVRVAPAGGNELICMLALSLPVKGLALTYGTACTATGRYGYALRVVTVEAVLTCMLASILLPVWGVQSAFIVLLAGAATSWLLLRKPFCS